MLCTRVAFAKRDSFRKDSRALHTQTVFVYIMELSSTRLAASLNGLAVRLHLAEQAERLILHWLG
jgi:hypothetical protein